LLAIGIVVLIGRTIWLILNRYVFKKTPSTDL
jgi:hypothetical protein